VEAVIAAWLRRQAGRVVSGWAPREVPFGGYLVCDRHRFAYLPIPKNATTTLSTWFLESVGTPAAAIHGSQVHALAWKHSITLRPSHEVRRVLDGYFGFVFVRNPWDRLVSGYLGKFVRNRNVPWDVVAPVVDAVNRRQGGSGQGPEHVTFRQFVDYVSSTEDRELDPHWRPQSCFVAGGRFDFVGRVERLTEDLDAISRRLGFASGSAWRNRAPYSPEPHGRCFADAPALELRRLAGLPRPAELFDRELIDRVQERYREDVATWGYAEARPVPSSAG
jgi:hypothetical protein